MVAVRRLAAGVGIAAVSAALAAGKTVVHRERTSGDVDHHDLSLDDLGVDHRWVTGRDGAQLHAITAGDPAHRPVVLLHGILLQAAAWRAQFALADRYRVVALDQRGHGRSTAGAAGYGLDRLADDLDALLEQLDVRDTIIVGHSMGGMAALRFARRHRAAFADRVAGVVLVSTSAHPVFGFGSSRVARTLAATLRVPAGAIGWDRVPTFRPGDDDFNFGVVRLSFGARPSPTAVDATRRMVAAMDDEAFSRSLVGLLDNDERAHLGAVDVPTEVLGGTRDLLTPPHHARRLASGIPGATLSLVDGCGHQLMMERPAELAAAIDRVAARADADQRGSSGSGSGSTGSGSSTATAASAAS